LDTVFLGQFWGLATTYTVYVRLIGKMILDLLFVLIDLFSLRRYERILIGNRRFTSAKNIELSASFFIRNVADDIANAEHFLAILSVLLRGNPPVRLAVCLARSEIAKCDAVYI